MERAFLLCLSTVHAVHIQLLHTGGVGLCPWLLKIVVLCPCFCFNVVLCPSDSFHAHFSAHFRAGVGLGNVTPKKLSVSELETDVLPSHVHTHVCFICSIVLLHEIYIYIYFWGRSYPGEGYRSLSPPTQELNLYYLTLTVFRHTPTQAHHTHSHIPILSNYISTVE